MVLRIRLRRHRKWLRHSCPRIALAFDLQSDPCFPSEIGKSVATEPVADLQSPAWRIMAHLPEKFPRWAEPVFHGLGFGMEHAPGRQPEPAPNASTWKWTLPAKSSAGIRAAARNCCARFVLGGRFVLNGLVVPDGLKVPCAVASRVALLPLDGQISSLACVRRAGHDGDASRASHRVPDSRNSPCHHFPMAVALPHDVPVTAPDWKQWPVLRATPDASRPADVVAD